ncbi:MAG: hypothetical protein NVSMB56_03770 [Pyrinomonadaceae bacterium]
MCLSGVAATWWFVAQRAARGLDETRARLTDRKEISFARKVHTPRQTTQIQFIQNTKNVRAVVRFHDALFAATEGGLITFDPERKLQRRYTALDGLPESDLTALAVAHDKLYIGTRTAGLVAFDGERFESFQWLDRQAGAITALQEVAGELLIGTFSGGLIAFEDNRFHEMTVGAERRRIRQVDFLRQSVARLYVGTFSDGLWLNDAGTWRHFTTSDGLPSNRIIGVAARDNEIFVATDFGLARASLMNLNVTTATHFQNVTTLPSLSGIAEFAGSILVCRDDGTLFMLSNESNNRAALNEINVSRSQALSDCRLNIAGDELLLTGNRGIYRVAAKAASRFALTPFAFGDETAMPSSNLISALTFDGDKHLWAGNFRTGIDVFVADAHKVAHIENDELREINALVANHAAHRVYAATAQGVWRFDRAASFNRATQITIADGLLSNAVMHLAVYETPNERNLATDANALFYATSRGVSFGANKNLRALTTVQGLPSNSAYTLLRRAERVYVGTLGGLVLIENGRVVRVFRDDNSKLTQNWVTGLCAADSRIFVGTYGGGVFELTAAGELNNFTNEIGKQTINPNAMWTDDARLYVGTLDGAWILDLHTARWTHLKDELPSPVVLSVTANERAVYFGTTAGIARVEHSYFDETHVKQENE